jgi:DNA-binding NtrC family response regulator
LPLSLNTMFKSAARVPPERPHCRIFRQDQGSSVELLAKALGCPKPRLTRAGIETLRGYDWPGNIRELRNVFERAVIFARGGALDFDLPLTGSSGDLTSFGPRDGDQAEPEYLTDDHAIEQNEILDFRTAPPVLSERPIVTNQMRS